MASVSRLPAKDGDGARPGGGVLAQISNAIVQLHKRHYGKGPTRARTIYSEDLVLTRLESSLTRAEETLVGLGRGEDVRKARIPFQHAFVHEFVACIEHFTGRKVDAYISDIHPATGIAVELFLLEREC